MQDLSRGKLAAKYIFFEMLPTFLIGVFVFIFIVLMFQSFRLTEYVLVHGASVGTIGRILFYMTISFLPVILPMSLLFAVLLTYGRLSNDSEVIAFKALGLNTLHLAMPAIILSSVIALTSIQTSFYLAPWGNRKMEVLIHKLGETKPGANIKEGVFSEGFFDMVIYTNEIDSKNNVLKKVFIFDERKKNDPLTIIASEGKLMSEKTSLGNKAFLRLFDGNIHRSTNDLYTKVNFQTFDINLFDAANYTEKKKTPLSYTLSDLRIAFQKPNNFEPKFFKKLQIEYHRRGALAFACILFGLVGVALGTVTNKRSGKSSGFVVCIGLVVAYWILYAISENLAKGGGLPVWLAIWITNIAFGSFVFYRFKKLRV